VGTFIGQTSKFQPAVVFDPGAVMAIPARLTIGPDGRLRGTALITWNDQFPWKDPWPTASGTPGGFGTPYGGVIHTEVGFERGTIREFNELSAEASAFFSIGMDGHIHQYGPLGQNWMAWTQVNGNPNWRGVEHEDQGNPSTPMTQPQLVASAQVFEAMSAFDGSLGNPWPLAPADDPVNGRGIIFHVDGGQAWGGHDCPGTVRMGQRATIIGLALQIRAGGTAPA
jgi:N-acetylmuramoyl-L-alanine amidase